MKKRFKPLGDLEQEVMRIVWQKGCAKVRCVHETLHQERGLAYTTVMTTMDRLVKKGILERVKIGKAYEYHARYSQVELQAQTSRTIIDSLLISYGDLALVQFIDIVDSIDPKKLEALRNSSNRS